MRPMQQRQLFLMVAAASVHPAFRTVSGRAEENPGARLRPVNEMN